ncbi:MAG: serine hydrolase [Bacteroidetes bacterium]|nr:serine hydrolase [Bacteroidota bacterium]
MRIFILLVITFFFSNLTLYSETKFNPGDLIRAAEYLKNNSGVAVLVMQNGNLILENYHSGADENTATHIHSSTKTVWSAIAALVLQKRLIESYDELMLRNYFPGFIIHHLTHPLKNLLICLEILISF